MTQQEVIAEKQKKMDELREKAKKAKDAKDALKKKIKEQDDRSPFPYGFNYNDDSKAVEGLETEIANLEMQIQNIENTSWRNAMNVVKGTEIAHDEIVKNISHAEAQIRESLDKDQERKARISEYRMDADKLTNWVKNNLDGKKIYVQYTNIAEGRSIGAGAKVLIEQAQAMEELANKYEVLDGKLLTDNTYISDLRNAAKKCRELHPAINEYEQGVMKMQGQQAEKKEQLAPQVQAWKQKAETFTNTWKLLDARAIANDPDARGVAIVNDKIQEGLALQKGYQEISSVVDNKVAELNSGISSALSALEALKPQVKEIIYAQKKQKVEESLAVLKSYIDGNLIANAPAMETARQLIKDLEDLRREMRADGVAVNSPLAQSLRPSMDELKRIQTEIGKKLNDEQEQQQEQQEKNDRELIQEVDKVLESPVSTLLNPADARAHVRKVNDLLQKITDRLSPGSTPNALFSELENRAYQLNLRLDDMNSAVPALRGRSDAAPDRDPDGMWANVRTKRAARLNAMAEEKTELAKNVSDPDLKARLLEDAEYFKEKARGVFGVSIEQFQQEIVAERTSIPNIRAQLEQAIATLESPDISVRLPIGLSATSLGLSMAAFNYIMNLDKPQRIAALKRQLAALPDDLDAVPDMV